MDLSTLLLGTMLAVLALAGAGLLATMVVLERQPSRQLEPAAAHAGRDRGQSKTCARRGRTANARRRRC